MVEKMQPGLDIENDQPNADPFWNSGIFVHTVERFNLKLHFSSLTIVAQPIQIQSCLMLPLLVLLS